MGRETGRWDLGGLEADCREGAEQNGYTVQGFAPTSRAAHQFRDGELGKDRW